MGAVHRESLPHGSAVLSAGFDRAEEVLELGLAGGHVVEYADVPLSVYHALLAAADPDRFVAEHVRDRFHAAPVA